MRNYSNKITLEIKGVLIQINFEDTAACFSLEICCVLFFIKDSKVTYKETFLTLFMLVFPEYLKNQSSCIIIAELILRSDLKFIL